MSQLSQLSPKKKRRFFNLVVELWTPHNHLPGFRIIKLGPWLRLQITKKVIEDQCKDGTNLATTHPKIIWKYFKKKGETIPKWFGWGYYDYDLDAMVCYPIPINLIVVFFRWLLMKLKFEWPDKFRGWERLVSHTFKVGYDRGHEDALLGSNTSIFHWDKDGLHLDIKIKKYKDQSVITSIALMCKQTTMMYFPLTSDNYIIIPPENLMNIYSAEPFTATKVLEEIKQNNPKKND